MKSPFIQFCSLFQFLVKHAPQGGPRPFSSSGPTSSITSSPAKSSLSGATGGVNAHNTGSSSTIGTEEYRELRAQLDNSEVKVQKLIESNDDMRTEISR